MVTNDLQKRIRGGEREAFRSVYAKFGRGVYFAALDALRNEEAARAVVKKVFLTLHSELMSTDDDLDIPPRIKALTQNELLLLQVLGSPSGQEAAAAVGEQARATAADEPLAAPEPIPADAGEKTLPVDLPPLERTRAYMRADGAENGAGAKPTRRKKHGFLTFLLVVFLLALLWVLAGVLMGLGYVPQLDLGYNWFNMNVFPFFSIGA